MEDFLAFNMNKSVCRVEILSSLKMSCGAFNWTKHPQLHNITNVIKKAYRVNYTSF